MAGYSTPYAFANYLGEWANDAAALTELRARKWDSTADGLGNPRNGMTYYATGTHTYRGYQGGAWVDFLTPGVLTLDNAYNGGRFITADAGAVDISVPVAVNGTALSLHQLMPLATVDVLTIENLGNTGASIGLMGTRRWIESDGGNMRIQLTASDALAYALQIFAENLGGGTAGIGIDADDDITITATNGQLLLHGFNGVGGAGVAIEATAGGGEIAIGAANVANQISVGTNGARNIQIGYSGSLATTVNAMDVGLLADTNDALAHAIVIRATNAGVGTAILNIDADDAITIDSLAAGFSIDGVTASNVCTTTGNLTLDATAGKLYVGTGAGGSSVAIGNLLRAMTVDADTYTLTATGLNGNLQILLHADVAVLRDLTIDCDNVNALGARITFSDSWQKDSGGAGGYTVAMPFGTTAAEWTLFKNNFGDGTSLLNAINQCASSAVTLDEAYAAAAATVAVNDWDVTWTTTGAYSHIFNLAGCTGVADGFFIEDGTDYFRFTHAGANTLNLSAELGSAIIGTSLTFDLNATGAVTIDAAGASAITIGGDANTGAMGFGTAGARTVTVGNITTTTGVIVNTGTSGFQVNTTGAGTVDINGTNAVTIDAATGLSLDGVGASNLTATSGTLTLSTLVSGTLIVNSIGLLDIDAAANIDMDVTGTFDMLSTGVFSIDGTGASNVTASSGNLTLSTLVSGGLILNSIGIVDIDGTIGTWNATSLTLTTSLGFDVNATGAVTLDAAGTSAITIGGDADTGAMGFGTAGARQITIGNTTTTTGVAINTGTSDFAINTNQLYVDQPTGFTGFGTATPLQRANIQSGAIRFDYVPTLSCAAAVLGAGAAGVNTNGVHSIKLTAVNALGETELWTGSGNYTVVANEQIACSNLPVSTDSTVTGRYIHMNKAGGAIWYRVALLNNVDTTYNINVADTGLVDAGPSRNTTSCRIFAGAISCFTVDSVGSLGIGGDGTFSVASSPGYTQIMAGPSGAIFFRANNGGAYYGRINQYGIGSLGATPTSGETFAMLGTSAAGVKMQRHTTANTAGNTLSVVAGGATLAATDKAGGPLYLVAGTATGSAGSYTSLWASPIGGAGVADNAPVQILTAGPLSDGAAGTIAVGIGTILPTSLLDLEILGASKAVTDVLELTNRYNAADMDGTGSAILWNQWYYDAATPAVADAGRIACITENDWTSVNQDSCLAFYNAGTRAVEEKMRLNSKGTLQLMGTAINANAYGALHLFYTGTVPIAATADSILAYAVDSSDNTATLGLFLEQAVEAIGAGFTPDFKLKILVGGVEYRIALEAV